MKTSLWLFALSLASAPFTAGTLGAQDFSPPAANLPSEDAAKQIAEKAERLTQRIARLQKLKVADALLADAEVYLHAAQAIVRHKEFYHKDSARWTLDALDRGLLRARFLASGDTPWMFAPGQTVARGYRSRIDNSVQPFAVSYPHDYGKDPKKRWRVDVELHGRDTSLTEVKFLNTHNGSKPAAKEQDFVQISIFGRGNNAYRWAGETDVFEAIERFLTGEPGIAGNLPDPDRIILRGFSMGGAGTWHLGLHWPGRWRVIGPGAGFTTTHGYAKIPEKLPAYQEACLHIYDAVDYATNAFNVPVVAYSGADDPQKQAADNIEAILKKQHIAMTHVVAPGLKHQFPREWFAKANLLYAEYAGKPRSDYPGAVNFVTYTMKYSGCHWMHILGLEQHYAKASVEATHAETGYRIKTQNVRVLRLTMPDVVGQRQEIEIDAQQLSARPVLSPVPGDFRFYVYLQRREGKWTAVLPQRLLTQRARRPQKVHNLQGPIDDAFADAFLCVRGTGKAWHDAPHKLAEARLERFGRDWSKYWRGELPVKDDVDVTNEDIAGHNLVLFGDPSSNSLIAQVLDGLPLAWTQDEIRFAGRKVAADRHLPVLIYPNPLNPQRYVVLNSGHTFPTADYPRSNALLYPRLGDYALLQTGAEADRAVVTTGLFDDYWELPKK